MKKHFTISSSPTEKNYIEFTKKLTDSDYSKLLNSLEVNDLVTIDSPYGKFTFEGEYENIAMLSGGIGITPLRSICKFCSDLKLKTNIVLLYGNLEESDIIFKNELVDLHEKNKNLKVIFTLEKPSVNWTGYKGYVDICMIKKEIPDYKKRVFYTCGPPAMVTAMINLLEKIKVERNRILKETFPGY